MFIWYVTKQMTAKSEERFLKPILCSRVNLYLMLKPLIANIYSEVIKEN